MKNIQQQKRKNEIEKETKKTIIELIHHFYITKTNIIFIFGDGGKKAKRKEKKEKS